jgi:hypothetical protein
VLFDARLFVCRSVFRHATSVRAVAPEVSGA